jgi:hypothetical protein
VFFLTDVVHERVGVVRFPWGGYAVHTCFLSIETVFMFS